MSRVRSLVLRLGVPPALVALLFLWLGLVAGGWLGLEGTRFWVLRIGLWTLGLVAAVLLFLLLRARDRARPTGGAAQVDAVLDEAEAGLARHAGGGRLATRPVVILAGPTDAAKTTLVTRSGERPVLLAGEVLRGEDVVPTPGVNAWAVGDAVWIEAGAPVLDDEARWERLASRLRPARWRAALGRGRLPSRVALVCYPATEFLRPGARDEVPAAAAHLRERLAALSRSLGVRLPVYVAFTKVDRVPHFGEYVAALGETEGEEAVGVVLPAQGRTAPAGGWAEEEAGRIHRAFQRLTGGLALWRGRTVRRGDPEAVRAGAYEFPREVGKLEPLVTRFLVELGRPDPSGSGPWVRGFHWVGVRPLEVADAGGGTPAPDTSAPLAGATGVFRLPGGGAAAPPSTGAGGSAGTRRIPQWAFLRGFVRDVLLRDEVARSMTSAGARVDVLRRALLAAGCLLVLGWGVGMTVSFFGNRALLADAVASADVAREVGEAGIHPAPEPELADLDPLRAQVAQLRTWEVEGRPRRLAFGLYTGRRILPELRGLYFHRFERAMWGRTRGDLEATLTAMGTLPADASAADGPGYGEAYDALKAYLITTDHPQRSTPEFLTPVLLRTWTGSREVDEGSRTQASAHFDLYATELAVEDPFQATASQARVAGARAYLGRFADADQFYQVLLAEAADEGAQPIQFHRLHPGSEAAVRAEQVIPAAFTREGWNHIQAALADVDRLFARESWVLGDRTVAPADRERLARELAARYEDDYVSTWGAFLDDARVLPFSAVPEAATRLGRLSGNQSPLLQLLATASRHTAVDTGRVGQAFQPVHAVTPPEITDRFISDPNQGYIQGLGGVHAAMERAAAAQGSERTAALTEASGAVDQARMQVRQIAQAFRIDGEAAQVGSAVQRLMMSPLDDAERLARAGPGAEANAGGAAFCASFQALASTYPFSIRGSTEASLDAVTSMFHPTESQLASFESGVLQGIVVPMGNTWGPAPGAPLRPTDSFLRFFTRAKQLSRGLFTPAGEGPQVAFTLRPQATDQVTEVIVTVDGQRQEVSQVSQASRTFSWEGARAGEARIEGVVQGNRVTLFASFGTWATFRMFHRGRWEPLRPGVWQVTWDFQQPRVTLTAEVSFERGLPVFDPAFMEGLGCVSRVVN
jgi:type VI secretion system protein ImpL